MGYSSYCWLRRRRMYYLFVFSPHPLFSLLVGFYELRPSNGASIEDLGVQSATSPRLYPIEGRQEGEGVVQPAPYGVVPQPPLFGWRRRRGRVRMPTSGTELLSESISSPPALPGTNPQTREFFQNSNSIFSPILCEAGRSLDSADAQCCVPGNVLFSNFSLNHVITPSSGWGE